MKHTKRVRAGWVVLGLVVGFWAAMPCVAADAPEAKTAPAATPAAAPAAAPTPAPEVNTGDNAWMLTSSALVLMMTGPALALFYCGLVRKKNVLSVMMQCVTLMGLMTVIWAIYGYSLSFSGNNPWIGDLKFLFLNGCQPVLESGKAVIPINTNPANNIPANIPILTHMLFQGMFFIITPALICGAFAERMKFSTMVVFMILWGTIVYCPLAHWVWGNGILAYGSDNAKGICAGGALDFAGGTVVHISSGVSALLCAILIGKRLGTGSEPMPPHNMTYTVIGATLLWVGWFGFNAGSALGAGGLAASAFAATHLAAAAGAVTWAGLEWFERGKPTVLGACSGLVAGLVCVTPAAGYILPIWGLAFGLIVGVVCYLSVTRMKNYFGYDDSLDAFGVHGVGGTLGAILTGVFATRATGATEAIDHLETPLGLIEGGKLLTAQIVATAITWVLALAATFVILKVLDATMGLRVAKSEEIQGLDASQHNEEGYIFI